MILHHQLILLEEFKECLPLQVKTYLDERKMDQVVVMVDLPHKSTLVKIQLD